MAVEKLYTRKIEQAPEKPVVNGIPLFGSFQGCFKNFDIRGLRRPFGNFPFPSVITNLRITGAVRFLFCDDEVIGEAAFFRALSFHLWKQHSGFVKQVKSLLIGNICREDLFTSPNILRTV